MQSYLHYEAPKLPPRPPAAALAPPAEEQLASSLASILFCGIGGVAWGAAAGMLRNNRARRPVWRSSLATMCGATLFEALMQLKLAAAYRVRAGPVSAPAPTALHPHRDGSAGAAPMPLYRSLRGFAGGVSLDIAISSGLLLGLIQPSRFPLAFGGWVLGRGITLSQEVEVALHVIEVPDEEL